MSIFLSILIESDEYWSKFPLQPLHTMFSAWLVPHHIKAALCPAGPVKGICTASNDCTVVCLKILEKNHTWLFHKLVYLNFTCKNSSVTCCGSKPYFHSFLASLVLSPSLLVHVINFLCCIFGFTSTGLQINMSACVLCPAVKADRDICLYNLKLLPNPLGEEFHKV